jgi:spore cortex formation protein SpoVR/YcgB (stage V sporulation)
MSRDAFKAKAYIKEGCPFSFKFLTFMTEAKLLAEIEIVRVREGDADYEAAKKKLADHLGKASFPTVEVEPNEYMTDSDRLIEHYAKRANLRPDEMPVLSLYKQGILPKLFELHKLKTGAGKS